MNQRSGGIIIGRFMPPHTGHLYLIDFAKFFCEELTVFLCTLDHEPIPGDLRFAWLREMFPSVHIVHITDEIPQAERGQEGAHQIWAEAVRGHLSAAPRYVFASEAYGLNLATALGADFVPVDPNREAFPISAGMIREDPMGHWRFIPKPVRPYFVRRISVIGRTAGVVSTLASRFKTVHCSSYLEHLGQLAYGEPSISVAADIYRAQMSAQRALARHANRILFLECDLLLLRIKLSRGATELPGVDGDDAPHVVIATVPLDRKHGDALAAASIRVITVDAGRVAKAEIEVLAEAVSRAIGIADH